jgi:hypothetical protein
MGARILAVALACAAGCGGRSLVGAEDPPPRSPDGGGRAGDVAGALAAALEAFYSDLAVATCHRLVECCAAADMLALVGTSDESACAASLTSTARDEAQATLSFDGIGFDSKAAATCLSDVRADACVAVFEPKAAGLIPCHEVFPGTRAVGDACDEDWMCATGRCRRRLCENLPTPPACGAAEAVDPLTNMCVPQRAVGETCGHADPCTPPLVCGGGGTCIAILSDGEACTDDVQCPGACVSFDANAQARACRPILCQGR